MALKLSDVLFNSETFLWYFNEVPVKRRGRIFLAHLQISIRNHRLYNRYI
jgi:hypothetical protein